MFGLNEALMSFIRRQVGLRTDAGDANGSLHGKVKEVSNYVNNVLGNPSHSRADNTVMGWLNSSVKSVQRGAVVLGGSTQTVTISSVNMLKSIVLVNHTIIYEYTKYTDGARALLKTSTSLEIKVGGQTDDKLNVAWQVIEFY